MGIHNGFPFLFFIMEYKEFANLDFLSNAVNPDEIGEVNLEELSRKIKISLESILLTRFPGDPVKSVLNPIKQKSDRFTFSCPHCGDSTKNSRNQRGHIHLGNMAFKCWNGGCNVTFQSLFNFLKHFDKLDKFDISEQAYIKINFDREKKSGSGGSGVINNSSSYNTNSSRKIHAIANIDQYAIPRKDIMDKMNLVEVSNSIDALKFLEKRMQLSNDMRHFAWNSWNKNLYVFNLSKDKNGVIGVQIRYHDASNGKRFHSYQYSDIWEKIFKSGEVKEEIRQKMNRLSLIYNILHIDYMKPINVFEGSIDSHHMPNSIATWSASTKLYLPTGRYFYDNTLIDKAGLKASMHMLDEGHYVFLWQKFLDDYPEYYDCKDLNDIFRLKPISIHKLGEYFSKEEMDLIYL
jgi:hypothetical protein